MNFKKKIVIINKEKIFQENNSFFCDNIDLKSIPEGLKEKFDILLVADKSKIPRSYKINLENIKISSNIFKFLYETIRTFKNKNTSYLLISITPYSFFSYLLLLIFRKKIFVYLRSNGYEEYRAILGIIGPIFYHIMFSLMMLKSNVITCQKRLVKKKNYNLVFPSELDTNWTKNPTVPFINKAKLLYVGRLKVEKGIFSLLKIFDKINDNVDLSILGKMENVKIDNKKINLISYENNMQKIIKIYDDHNIIILPSYTEAHPKVVDESLARLRPVIIFEEISHIIQYRKGVFVAKRNDKSLMEIINFIMNNFKNIQNDIKKNNLPTKEKFISQLTQILN